jgi:multicomponent Na+:H+ antiporter subunit B
VRAARWVVAVPGLLLTVGGFAWAAAGVHGFGADHSRYGSYVAHESVPQRSATNAVVVTAFDYRAVDTLGEEFILFIAVAGTVVLLRTVRGDVEEKPEEELLPEQRRTSESGRWLGVALVGPITLLGAYVVTHGQLTPGGGFQGGVILMSALTFIFLGGEYLLLLRLRRSPSRIEIAESAGAAAFAVIGFGGLVAGGAFFYNFIPKGSSGLLTGGMIPLANIAVGIEVAGALLMLLSELLDQRLLRPPS